jgi:hypothetical protein
MHDDSPKPIRDVPRTGGNDILRDEPLEVPDLAGRGAGRGRGAAE